VDETRFPKSRKLLVRRVPALLHRRVLAARALAVSSRAADTAPSPYRPWLAIARVEAVASAEHLAMGSASETNPTVVAAPSVRPTEPRGRYRKQIDLWHLLLLFIDIRFWTLFVFCSLIFFPTKGQRSGH